MENVKIDLFDLIRRLLHQWKFILIVTLVCGLVFEGIGYARAYMSYRQELEGIEPNEEKTSEEYLSDLEEMEEDLTDQEIADARSAAFMYATYWEKYEEELLYCQNSIKMQLNANEVLTYTAHYKISSDDTDIQNEDLIAAAVSDMIKKEETCEEIRNQLGWDTELSYIAELIGISAGGTISVDETNLDILDTVNQITVQIQAPSREECDMMVGILKSCIDQLSWQFQEIYGEFEMTLTSESYVEVADNTLRSYQENRYSALNTLRNSMNSLSNNMSSDQMDYYETLLEYNMAEEGREEPSVLEEEMTEEAEETGADEEKDETVSAPGIIRWRFILLGLVIGFVLACGYILLRYILAKNLRVKDDLEDAFHIPTLGYIPLNDKRQRFTREERMEMICAGIRIAVQKADLKNVYITGTAGDGESEKVMEQMQEALADCGAQVNSGRDVACDPASLQQMTASDGVVFVERVDRSPYADIQKEVELCQMYNVPVIGSVVIE